MSPRLLGALALADFRERVRRPSYLVVLLSAVGLGYLAVPAAANHWTIVNAGAYRGVYNSAYVGTVTALAAALWLATGGFYVIRTAIARDRQTGVGQLLAATPMRAADYLIGKFLSNLLVLASMAGAVAVTAVAMQVARGESGSVNPIVLLTPFLLCTLPTLAMTAAAAIIFATTPILRDGLGNVLWLFVSLTAAIAGQSANAPLGGLGVSTFAESLRDSFAAQGIKLTDLSLGLMYLDTPPHPVPWNGIDFTAAFTAQRVLLLLLATATALIPALWFDRFDPSRTTGGGEVVPQEAPAAVPAGAFHRSIAAGGHPMLRPTNGHLPAATTPFPSGPRPAADRPATAGSPPRAAALVPRRGAGFARVVRGELRILTRGVSRWWWLGSVALVVAGLAVPAAAGPLLVAAWIWPVLVWSRLGCQARELGAEALLDACPAPALRTLAQWLAGVALTAAVGIGPGVAMTVHGQLAGWLAGVAFISALALALGVAGRTQRFFQAVYPLLWYLVVNDVAGLDYMGVLPGGPTPLVVATTAALLLLSALTVVAVRHRRR